MRLILVCSRDWTSRWTAQQTAFSGRVEVIEGRGRRLRTEEERARIAAESMMPGAKVADVARRHGVTRWQV
jgi:transposase